MQGEELIGLFSYFKHVIDTLPGEACAKIADLIVDNSMSNIEDVVDQYYEKVKVRALHLGELKELFAKNETAGFSECTLRSFEINLMDEWENEGKLNPDQVVVDKFKYYFPTKKGSPSLLNTYIFSTVEQGCLKACCPYTGEILSSTKSFPIFMEEKWNHVVFYRFEGKKVFYVGVAGYPALKACVYLPHENLCVISPPFLHLGYSKERIVETITEMYTKFLLYSHDVIEYVNAPSTGVGVLYGLQTNLGHFFTNEYAGLYRLVKARLCNKICAIVAYKNQKMNLSICLKNLINIKFIIPRQKMIYF